MIETWQKYPQLEGFIFVAYERIGMVDIVPAILSYSRQDLSGKLSAVSGVARIVHIDVMDGSFVKNKTVGVAELSILQIDKQIEYHLMVSDPARYMQELPGGPNVTYQVHIESARGKINDLLGIAAHKRSKLAVAINPATPLDEIAGELPKLSHVLVMAVVPGIDGQKYMPQVEVKISQLRNMAPGIIIEVDGGIGLQTAGRAAAAGANRLAAATAIFGSSEPVVAFRKLYLAANGGSP